MIMSSEAALAERIRIGRRSSSSRMARQNGQPIDDRQHDVEHDQIRPDFLPLLQSGGSITGADDPVSLQRQVQFQSFGDVDVILDDQDAFLIIFDHENTGWRGTGAFPSLRVAWVSNRGTAPVYVVPSHDFT